MKKVFALFLALVLLSAVVATCLAAPKCSHQMVYHSTYTNYYTKPRWTNCGYNHNIHAHTLSCKDTIKVYVCQKCSYSEQKVTTKVLSETCPCVH